MTGLDVVVSYLDELLQTATVPDYPPAHNGLQVHGTRAVSKVLTAVDACQATIDRAVETDADLIIVHHGLFWDGAVTVTDRRYRRLAPLVTNGIALYASHLPLDCHDEFGNNAILARSLGLKDPVPWGDFEGALIGRIGGFEGSRSDLEKAIEGAVAGPVHTLATGPDTVSRVAVVTGGGGSMISEAAAAGADALVTGEGAHHTYFDAEESGVNVYYAGHYATEVFGVKALGEHLASRFGAAAEFFDHPTGL